MSSACIHVAGMCSCSRDEFKS